MTVPVPDQLEYISDADGVTKDFPYPKRFLQKDEIVVLLRDADGVDTPQILNTHYTIAGSSWPSGGTISFITAPQAPNKVVRYRMTQAKQTVDLENNQRNDAPSVETQLDRLTMAIQDRGARTDAAWFGLLAEVIARKSGDAALNSRVDQEIIDRDAGDKAVASLIGQAGPVEPGNFDTRLAVTFANIKPTINSIRTGGYALPGDGGAALYKRVASEPAHIGKVQSADGAWWELAETEPNLKMFGAIGDGVSDDQAAIVEAVRYAVQKGTGLEWPGEVYASSGNIPDFHNIRHSGQGVIKRGSVLFRPSAVALSTNTIHVAPSGVSENDGIGPETPTTLDGAYSILKKTGPYLRGEWVVLLSAGAYGKANVLWEDIFTDRYLVIRGPDVSNGVPTAIVDANGGDYGLYLTGKIRARVKDVKFINATGSSVASGLVADNGVSLWADNVHTFNTTWSGINANHIQRLYVYGGIFDTSTYGVRAYAQTHFTVGRDGQRPIFRNCTSGFIAQGASYGHCDFNDFINCATGITAEYESHSTSYNNFFTSCNRLHHVGINSSISRKNNTGAAGSLYDVARFGGVFAEDDKPYRFMQQFYPDWGVNGRFKYGYTSYGNPSVAFQFSKDGTVAGGVAGFAAAIALFESDGNSVLGLASPDASYSSIWFGSPVTANKSEIRGEASGSLSVLMGGQLKYSFRTSDFVPRVDNSLNLGSANLRYSVIYAGTGTINTSDAREKEWRGGLNEAEINVAKRLSKLIGIYKWKAAIAVKGEDARLHAGVQAQDVIAAFEAEGLDAFKYGLVCYNEWDEAPEITEPVLGEDGKETGEMEVVQPYQSAGNRYGVRHDELWSFLAAGYEQRLKSLEEALHI